MRSDTVGAHLEQRDQGNRRLTLCPDLVGEHELGLVLGQTQCLGSLEGSHCFSAALLTVLSCQTLRGRLNCFAAAALSFCCRKYIVPWILCAHMACCQATARLESCSSQGSAWYHPRELGHVPSPLPAICGSESVPRETTTGAACGCSPPRRRTLRSQSCNRCAFLLQARRHMDQGSSASSFP